MLDAILAGYVDGDQGRDDLIAAGHDPALVDQVLRMVDIAEYKRRQSAPGTKISIKAFGRDRRLPITNRWREHGTPSTDRKPTTCRIRPVLDRWWALDHGGWRAPRGGPHPAR